MEKINYQGWENSYRLSNGIIELVLTTDVGPRIIRFGFVGGENEFKEYPAMLGKSGGNEWRIYGGHRLWHAPETQPRTYFPDNFPVQIEQHAGFVRLIQPVETTTGIQKELDLRLVPGEAQVEIRHRLRNTNLWTIELAPWALTVLTTNGKVIIPLPPRGTHPENLLPTNTLTLWAYTNMNDPRWTWGQKYILLRQDPTATAPQKIGVLNTCGWTAYARAGHLFVKKFQYVPHATYPDLGCTVETFTNHEMIELETLGPICQLAPGAIVEYREHWFLFNQVPVPGSDTDVEHEILPKIKAAQIK
ncbi:DUF4380 domain-containing protein [candidate division KSB1 bacterium]|nr:DUF4380 domain-containing protein [candidate division KSB1 bacterium]